MKRLLSSTSPFLFAAAIAMTGLVAACTITTANDTTSDGGASSSSGSSGTSSSSGDGGASSSSGGETGSGKYGVISMSQTTITAGATTIESYSLFASFANATGTTGTGTSGSGCSTSTEGACTVMDCTIASGDAGTPGGTGDAGSAKAPNAGDIAVSASLDVTLTPDGTTGSYAAKTGQVKLFAPDEDIAIDAKGNDVPAFKTNLTAPSLVTITAPTWPTPGQPLQIDRSKPLDLKWSDGKNGNVVVSVTSSSASKVGMVSCTFKAADGAGTIPSAALGKLDAAGSATIAINGSSTDSVKAGDYTVNVSATSPAKAGTSLASGQAKLQ